ncbi:hypothetical protein LTR36_000574 [Oleoguttula mirabilis]|uniref:Chromosome segregation in meiosis protein n=1 Tax=Oleoguttula mirabilis TaxID=1507867 RepID=A0AAV9JSV3_9PEZI|nr:hypothetical protein LTR36_000574 [Oleoguttula mirabilis]
MPTATAPNARAGSTAPEESDNRFNFDQEVDDFMRDLPIGNEASNDNAAQPAKDVDEEIKVRKKRMPVPKLDETRLLSDAGVPKLRKIAKTKLKFKGKGHEFTDISRLLNTYQLWLDDLYPRAKFRDALSMVEKLGHSKRMQITRRAWIDGTKPSRREASPERLADIEMSGGLDGLPGQEAPRREGDSDGNDDDDLFGERAAEWQPENAGRADTQHSDMPEDDELDALMAEQAPTGPGAASRPQQKPRGPFEEEDDDEDGGPDDDELDALMAEETPMGGGSKASGVVSMPRDDAAAQAQNNFADEEEIMAGMGGDW